MAQIQHKMIHARHTKQHEAHLRYFVLLRVTRVDRVAMGFSFMSFNLADEGFDGDGGIADYLVESCGITSRCLSRCWHCKNTYGKQAVTAA